MLSHYDIQEPLKPFFLIVKGLFKEREKAVSKNKRILSEIIQRVIRFSKRIQEETIINETLRVFDLASPPPRRQEAPKAPKKGSLLRRAAPRVRGRDE